MQRIALLLLITVAVANAAVTVTRTSNDGPHPSSMEIEVQLPNTNQRVLIPLERTDEFENVPITMMDRGLSMTFSAHQVHHPNHAHYRNVESKSVVSVRQVDGRRRISGHVMHEGASYFVEPVGSSEHRVTKNTASPDLMAKQVDRKRLLRAMNRRRRQAVSTAQTTYVVEIILLLDHTVWSVFRTLNSTDDQATAEIHYYYTHILNGIDTAYRNIGTPSISVKCIGMLIAKTQTDAQWLPPSTDPDPAQAGTILASMRDYTVKNSVNADHVMAFTRTDIKSGTNSAVCGMAYVSGACKDTRESINEDQGLQSWGTASHELAHNLGSPHDGDGNTCNVADKKIMSPQAGSYSPTDVANSYRFSDCTISSIATYINSLGAGNCLTTARGTQDPNFKSTTKEGIRLPLDRVCKYAFPSGPGKLFLSDDISGTPANICAKIYCASTGNSGITIGGLRAPAGTPCGSQKTCNWKGECTSDTAAPPADEKCFWGDSWDSETCQGWKGYLDYLKGQTDQASKDGLTTNCASVRPGCCKTLGDTCA